MGWFGKLAFGGMGLIFGGPLGAIAGAALGHHMIDKNAESTQRAIPIGQTEQAQAAYFVSVFSLLGKLAKADGVVSKDEIAVVEEFIDHMNMQVQEKQFAKRVFNEAKDSAYSVDDFAFQFYQMNRSRPAILISFMDVLFKLAAADGKLHPSEVAVLQKIRNIFRLNDTQYEAIKSVHFKNNDKYYKTLNCTHESSDQDIKTSYKNMVKEFHPDTIMAKGLPEEFIQFATQRFQEIQEAYESIRKERNF
jgi:DnaJ like chaperone protein